MDRNLQRADEYAACGRRYCRQGRREDALWVFEKAKDLYEAYAPHCAAYALLLYDLGVLYDDLKQKKRALEHLEHAAYLYRTAQQQGLSWDLAPFGETLCHLAFLYVEHGCPFLAVSAYEAALDVYLCLSRTDCEQYGDFVPLIRYILQDMR